MRRFLSAGAALLCLLGLGACALPPIDAPVTTSEQPTSEQTTVPPTQTQPPPTDGAVTGSPVAPTVSSPVVMNDDGTGTIQLGMTVEAFHQAATSLGWQCTPSSGLNDNDAVTCGTVYIRFWSLKLFSIGFSDTTYQTQAGLRVNDSVDRLTQLYGTKFEQANDSGRLTYYFIVPPKSVVLSAGINQQTKQVISWALSVPGSGPSG